MGLLSPASPVLLFKMLNVLGAQGWYYQQMVYSGAGPENATSSAACLRSFFRYLWDETTRTLRMRR